MFFRLSGRPRRPRLETDILEGEVEPALDALAHHVGDADPAGLGQPLQAGGDVDAVAENIVALDDDVAEVDADAVADADVLAPLRLPLGHRLLDPGGRGDRVDDAGELDQHPIARGLDDAAVVFGDCRVDHLVAVRPLARQGARLVRLHEPGVPDHVGRQHGRQPTFASRCAHATSSPVAEHSEAMSAPRDATLTGASTR